MGETFPVFVENTPTGVKVVANVLLLMNLEVMLMPKMKTQMVLMILDYSKLMMLTGTLAQAVLHLVTLTPTPTALTWFSVGVVTPGPTGLLVALVDAVTNHKLMD